MGGVAASSGVFSDDAGRVINIIAAASRSMTDAVRSIAIFGPNEFVRKTLKNWQWSLRSARRPAAGIADRRKRVAMERRGPVKTQSFEMVRSGVALVAREPVLRINSVPLPHACVAVRFGQDGRGSDGNAARVAFDQGLLLDEHIELHSIDEEVVWRNGELLKRGSHGLARSLINIPSINALRVDFGDGPSEGVFANAFAKLGTAI